MTSQGLQNFDKKESLEGQPEGALLHRNIPGAAIKSKKSDSAYRTISEVADDLKVQQHVLRFWETKFSQVKPLKRGGGRRYYRPEDIALLKRIHHLLYTQGFTIKGVQKLLREHGKQKVVEGLAQAGEVRKQPANASSDSLSQKAARSPANLDEGARAILKSILTDLTDLRRKVQG